MITDDKAGKRYRAMKCKHPNTHPTVYTHSTGGRAVWVQCLDCGEAVASERRAGRNLGKLPAFDDNFRQAQKEARREIYLRIWDEEREKEL